MKRHSSVRLLLCAMIGLSGVASADEDFCLRIPASALHFRYSPARDHVTLTVSVPARYLDAEFHYAQIQIGENPETESFLRFDAGMSRANARVSTQLVLPRKHPMLNFRAVYFGKKCLGELMAEFRNSGRVKMIPGKP